MITLKKFHQLTKCVIDSNFQFNFSSNTSPASGQSSPGQTSGIWRVRTLYACMAENDGELSFEPNQIITNGNLRLFITIHSIIVKNNFNLVQLNIKLLILI